jgi:glycosyltransferase involved in cell wall biosynthesis
VTSQQHPSTSVLHIGKYYWPHMGGIESHLRDLVRMQAARLEVQVIVANDSVHFEEEQTDGAVVTRVPNLGTIASMPITPTLPWNIFRRKADIIHVHLPNPWAALSVLLSGHKGKIVVTHHGDTVGRERLRKLTDPILSVFMRRASAIIVSSDRYLKSSEELEDFLPKSHVVALGLDASAFQSADSGAVAAIRAKYGDRIVLSVGRLVHYKGMEYLIESMRSVDGCLVHIGSGPLAAQLLEQAQKAGISNKIHLLGRVDDLAPYLQAATLFVLSSISRAESFGIVQLEAMAAGLPIINTDIESGVPQVSLHALTGLTVPPEDAEALAASINLLLHDKEMCRRFGESGKYRVRHEFSIEKMAEETLAIYESILDPQKQLNVQAARPSGTTRSGSAGVGGFPGPGVPS